MSDDRADYYGSGAAPTPQPQAPAEFVRPAATWQPPAPVVTYQPQPASKHSPRRMAASIVGVAVLAAGVGGGTGVLIGRSTAPAAVTTAATTTGTTVTKVVQGTSSNPDWTVVAKTVSESVVAITVKSSQGEAEGSGVVLDALGNIVTNNHVVSELGTGAAITVALGERTYQASIVGTDASTDLAVIKIANPPSDLQPIALADSSKLVTGQPVMAVGNPLGLSDSVTTGIISALNRPVTTQEVTQDQTQTNPWGNQQNPYGSQDGSSGATVVTNAIQTSAAINPGNSGGALVNANGELIGITSSIASLSGSSSSSQSGSIGIGFAIPANQVKYIADQIIATGSAKHAYLGVTTADGTATVNGATVLGASVQTVVTDSAAGTAGLKQGDVITALDGTAVVSSESLVGQIRAAKVGQQVTLSVVRNGQTQRIGVTLGEATASK